MEAVTEFGHGDTKERSDAIADADRTLAERRENERKVWAEILKKKGFTLEDMDALDAATRKKHESKVDAKMQKLDNESQKKFDAQTAKKRAAAKK